MLRGDPELVAAVADGLAFAHTYTSGVLAWAPEDHPTAAHISAVLDEFEATAWAGLDPDRYAWTAVQHDAPAGGVHVHILAARVDLETGKSLNIAPPGWQRDFDPLRGLAKRGTRLGASGRSGTAARASAGLYGLRGSRVPAPGPGLRPPPPRAARLPHRSG